MMYSGVIRRMREVTQTGARHTLPVIAIVTFLGFLDTHLLIPVMSLYASEIGAGALRPG